MKKSILILAMLLTTIVGSSFANKTDDNKNKAVASFKQDFASAKEVSWQNTNELLKATFKLNDQVMFAYYTESGELMAIVRNMVSGQLPINLLTNLKKNYQGYWITDLFEVSANNESSYYVTLASADNVVVLKSSGLNKWEVFQKEKK
jgi:hypothetical protein